MKATARTFKFNRNTIVVNKLDYQKLLKDKENAENSAKLYLEIMFSYVIGLWNSAGQPITESLLHKIMTDKDYTVIYDNKATGKRSTLGYGKKQLIIR